MDSLSMHTTTLDRAGGDDSKRDGGHSHDNETNRIRDNGARRSGISTHPIVLSVKANEENGQERRSRRSTSTETARKREQGVLRRFTGRLLMGQ